VRRTHTGRRRASRSGRDHANAGSDRRTCDFPGLVGSSAVRLECAGTSADRSAAVDRSKRDVAGIDTVRRDGTGFDDASGG
jgi:hypothetical protein